MLGLDPGRGPAGHTKTAGHPPPALPGLKCAAAEQPRTLVGRPYRSGADAATADAKSGSTPSCANMVVIPIWQLNSWILPPRTYQKSAVGMSSLAHVGWITPAGVSSVRRKVPPIDIPNADSRYVRDGKFQAFNCHIGMTTLFAR